MSKIWTAEEVRKIQQIEIMTEVTSLNTLVSSGADSEAETELGDLIPSSEPTPEELAIIADRREFLLRLMDKCLTPKELHIIKSRYGFDSDVMTLEELGKSRGLTRERVRQIEARALRKLKLKLSQMHIDAFDL